MLLMGAVLIGMGWVALATSALQRVSVLSTGSSSRAWKHRIRLSPDDIAHDLARILWGMCEARPRARSSVI